jgi:hypothetical protein
MQDTFVHKVSAGKQWQKSRLELFYTEMLSFRMSRPIVSAVNEVSLRTVPSYPDKAGQAYGQRLETIRTW